MTPLERSVALVGADACVVWTRRAHRLYGWTMYALGALTVAGVWFLAWVAGA